MSSADFRETGQRVHDYGHLIARWRRVARGAGLKLEAFATVGEYPIYLLRTRGNLDGGFYVSAGIHGDEPAGPEALLSWAEAHLARHVRAKSPLPLFILPCLNPWGIVNNQRTTARGHDLNRSFDRRISPIKELKRLLAGQNFALGVALHEDYDGLGMYLYEISVALPTIGAELLRHCKSKTIPIDPRRRIEDFPFKDGLLVPPIDLKDAPTGPEAFCLYPNHCSHFLTFETPSEFSLTTRVRAHVRLIEECVRRLVRARE